MKKYVLSLATASWLCFCGMPVPARAQTVPAPRADPGEAQVEAVLGPETPVRHTGPGAYVINGDDVSLARLLGTVLPERERTLKALQENLYQRLQIQTEAASGMSLEAKRAQCQALKPNTVDWTRCYQELVALREARNQSSQNSADARNDEESQMDKLQQQIEAIDEFRHQYGR